MFKYIKLISDLHLDGDWSRTPNNLWAPPVSDSDRDTVLVIAGDIWTGDRFVSHGSSDWLEGVAPRFHHVVLVLGNHDYWGEDLQTFPRSLHVILSRFKNVTLLQDSTLIIGGVLFVGGTLWTDYDRGNPVVTVNAPRIMVPDHTNISDGLTQYYQPKKVSVNSLMAAHETTRLHIFNTLNQYVEDGSITHRIVVSHMPPSFRSVHPMYHNERIANHYFFTDLDNAIADSSADFWFHGHVHNVCDYVIGSTRVMCNPRGYCGGERGNGFDGNFLLDITPP
jgi:predicted phosphohydrolase